MDHGHIPEEKTATAMREVEIFDEMSSSYPSTSHGHCNNSSPVDLRKKNSQNILKKAQLGTGCLPWDKTPFVRSRVPPDFLSAV